jgi:hypothetical protein
METAEAFESELRTLVDELRKGGEGWEVRQEPPSGAYLHVSLPQWGDEDMNGIHIETYVLGRELAARSAPVALHCESGCPFQRQFMKLFHERAAAHTEAWPGNYTMQVVNSSTACEISVPFASTPKETVQKAFDGDTTFTTTCPNRRRHYQGLHSSGSAGPVHFQKGRTQSGGQWYGWTSWSLASIEGRTCVIKITLG